MNDIQRDRLLERVDRKRNVGSEIPERTTVLGEELELREFVFEVRRHDELPEAVQEEVEDVLADLRRERLRRKQRLAREDLTVAEGEQLAEGILGLDRALNVLENPEGSDLEERIREAELESAREWLAFLGRVR